MKKTEKAKNEIIHPLDEPMQNATTVDTNSRKKKQNKNAARTAEEQTTPSPVKLTEAEKQNITALAHLLGIPQLVTAIKQIKQTQEQILVSQTGDKKSKEENPLGNILNHPVVKKFVGSVEKYLTGETTDKKQSIDKKLLNEAIKIANTLKQKQIKALDLITDNFAKGGKIIQNPQGDIVITRPRQPVESKKNA